MFFKELLDVVTLTKVNSTSSSVTSDCYAEIVIVGPKVGYLKSFTKVLFYAIDFGDV